MKYLKKTSVQFCLIDNLTDLICLACCELHVLKEMICCTHVFTKN